MVSPQYYGGYAQHSRYASVIAEGGASGGSKAVLLMSMFIDNRLSALG